MIALPLSYNTGEYPEGIFSSLTDASKEASCWRFERGGFYTWQELEEKGISTERDHVSLHLGWVQTENQDVEIIVVWPNVYACCDSEWEEYEIRVRFNLGGLEDFEEWREYDLRRN